MAPPTCAQRGAHMIHFTPRVRPSARQTLGRRTYAGRHVYGRLLAARIRGQTRASANIHTPTRAKWLLVSLYTHAHECTHSNGRAGTYMHARILRTHAPAHTHTRTCMCAREHKHTRTHMHTRTHAMRTCAKTIFNRWQENISDVRSVPRH